MKSAAKTSEQECQTMRIDIAYLTSHLQGLMQANAGQNDWGEAGSLEHGRCPTGNVVNGLICVQRPIRFFTNTTKPAGVPGHMLKRAVSFYGGLEDGEIEETLAELRD